MLFDNPNDKARFREVFGTLAELSKTTEEFQFVLDAMHAICKIRRGFMDNGNFQVMMNSNEVKLLNMFRSLDERGQRRIMRNLRDEYEDTITAIGDKLATCNFSWLSSAAFPVGVADAQEDFRRELARREV